MYKTAEASGAFENQTGNKVVKDHLIIGHDVRYSDVHCIPLWAHRAHLFLAF